MDGCIVGFDVLGAIVGTTLGDFELGVAEGESVGAPEGEVVGQTVGLGVGSADGNEEGF